MCTTRPPNPKSRRIHNKHEFLPYRMERNLFPQDARIFAIYRRRHFQLVEQLTYVGYRNKDWRNKRRKGRENLTELLAHVVFSLPRPRSHTERRKPSYYCCVYVVARPHKTYKHLKSRHRGTTPTTTCKVTVKNKSQEPLPQRRNNTERGSAVHVPHGGYVPWF